MTEKTQRDFTYLDWLRFCEYHSIAKTIRKRYKKKLAKLKGVDFMICQGEMWRKLGKAFREWKEQHKKPRRVSRSSKLKAVAEKQATRARAGRRIRSPVKAAVDEEEKMRSNPIKTLVKRRRHSSKEWLKKTKELGEKR